MALFSLLVSHLVLTPPLPKFCPDDGGNIFLRNLHGILTQKTAIGHMNLHRSESLKFYVVIKCHNDFPHPSLSPQDVWRFLWNARVFWTERRCRYVYYMASSGRMVDEWWIGKDLEGGGRGINEVLSRNLPGGTKENHEELEAI
jgi:hypothetical protein